MKSLRCAHLGFCAVVISLALIPPTRSVAVVPAPPPGGTNSNPWLDSWSFTDTNAWKSDLGVAPVSFTNLGVATLPTEGTALLVDTGSPAWIQFHVNESSGATNVNIVSQGSAMFWLSPDWASSNNTNEVGTGPGVESRILEAGTFQSNGWFGILCSSNGNCLYFVTQASTGAAVTNLSVPITFGSNEWHLIAAEWSTTNSALAIDGVVLTNGPGVSTLPGSGVQDFRIGSDATGAKQMRAAISDLTTYSYPLDPGVISGNFMLYSIFYGPSLPDFTQSVF